MLLSYAATFAVRQHDFSIIAAACKICCKRLHIYFNTSSPVWFLLVFVSFFVFRVLFPFLRVLLTADDGGDEQATLVSHVASPDTCCTAFCPSNLLRSQCPKDLSSPGLPLLSEIPWAKSQSFWQMF